jgi:hypothetical protein
VLVTGKGAVSAFQNAFVDQLANPAGFCSSRPHKVGQRPACDPILIAIVEDADDIHPHPTRCFRAAPQLGIVAPIVGIELK